YRRVVCRDDDVNSKPDQLGRELWKPLGTGMCPSPLDGDGFSLHVSEAAQAVLESIFESWAGVEHTYPRNLRELLRLSADGRYTEQKRERGDERDDTAVDHSMTVSARRSSDGGMLSPSALAVLRLMTSSNLVGCSTGRSLGLAPLTILSTYVAPRSAMCVRLGA